MSLTISCAEITTVHRIMLWIIHQMLEKVHMLRLFICLE